MGLLSEDEAEGMPMVPHQARRAVCPAPAPAPAPSATAGSAAAAPASGPGEVIVKKAALVSMKKQMAAIIRGEDLPAAQLGA